MSQSIEALEDLLASKLPLIDALRELLSDAITTDDEIETRIGLIEHGIQMLQSGLPFVVPATPVTA